MASDWIEASLSELTTKITKGTTPTKKDGGFSKEGVNYIKSESVTFDGRIDESKFTFISSEIHKKLKRSQLEENDILMSMAGIHLGKTAIVRTRHLPANTNQALALIRPIKNKICPDYLFYFLQQSSVVHFINNSTSQSAQPNINLQEIGSLKIKLPLLTEQKAIANILGSLDDKIELNRQMNETLEAMAQALFKSWFVDFDPVIDNALAAGNAIPDEFFERAEQRKGIEKKDNSDIQDLFPDEFELSEEMGWIPKGWEVTTLEDLAVISSSKRIFAKEYETEGIPFFRGKEISLLSKGDDFTSDIFISNERFCELKDKFGAPSAGDLLLTSVGTIGNVYLVQEGDEFYFKDGNLTWFSEYKTEIKGAYLSTWFKTRQAYLAIENIKIGSTQQAITISSLNGIKIVKPENNLISLFNNFSGNAVKKISLLSKERRTLSSLRDTLLPKLMSGELRIPDAAALVDEAL